MIKIKMFLKAWAKIWLAQTLMQHWDNYKDRDLLGKCSFMARESPAHVLQPPVMKSRLLLSVCCSCRNLLGGWDRDNAKAPAFAGVLGLVSELAGDTAQSRGGQGTSNWPPAQWGCNISPGCGIPAHGIQHSISVAPAFSDSKEIL